MCVRSTPARASLLLACMALSTRAEAAPHALDLATIERPDRGGPGFLRVAQAVQPEPVAPRVEKPTPGAAGDEPDAGDGQIAEDDIGEDSLADDEQDGVGAPVGAVEDPLAMQAAISRFVDNFYLAGEDLDAAQLELIYGERVAYFGQRRKARAGIIADKLAYYKRWPQRFYARVPGSLSIERLPGPRRRVEVRFDYEFDLAGAGRRSAGRGSAILTLDLTSGGGRIVREEGRVLERARRRP